MKRILIISSYREACGPAAHTIYLEKSLREFDVEVEIFKLNVYLLRSPVKVSAKAVREELSKIIHKANKADGVIFQLEPGLYGIAPWISYPRINKLLDKIKTKTLVVIHGFDRPSKSSITLLDLFLKFAKPVSFFSSFKDTIRTLSLFTNSSYRGFFKRLRKKRVVTFSLADQRELKLYKNVDSTYVPISYLTSKAISKIKESSNTFRNEILDRLDLNENSKLIISPGFINTYKNIITTVDSLQFLPENYHLIIAGALHPHSSQLNKALEELLEAKIGSSIPRPYYTRFLNETEKNLNKPTMLKDTIEYPASVRDRIHFVGAQNDDLLNEWIAASDYVVLPYLDTETGQSGSGPFTLAIELGRQSFFGSASVFKAQSFVNSTSPFLFDSANSKELAYCLKNAELDKKYYEEFVKVFSSNYNAHKQSETYLKLLEE